MKIIFQSDDPVRGLLTSPPVPAKAVIPEWYKNMPQLTEGATKPGLRNEGYSTNRTAKGCQPLLDALTSGYIYCLPADVEVRMIDGLTTFKWRAEGDYISPHAPEQYPGMPPAVGGNGQVMKWAFSWTIKLPDGYSMLFSHPFNRHDLPFRTLTGVVDCDQYPNSVQFPFELIVPVGERMILERGTPVCQMLPFKREAWRAEAAPYNGDEARKRQFLFSSKIIRSYKNQFWTRKSYE